MNKLKYLFAIVAVMGALTMPAKADLKFLGFQQFDNPDNNAHLLLVLAAFLGQDPSAIAATGGDAEGIGGVDKLINVTGNFLVAHYGGPHGGSFEFFQILNGETQVTVPGDPNPLDTFANQNSLSAVRQYSGPTGVVPDGGTTVMLLGAALGTLGMARRFLKR